MNNKEKQYDIVVKPEIGKEALTDLTKLTNNLDWLLDAPEARDMPRAVSETGILEEIGRRLWGAIDLDTESLLEKMEDVRDADAYVRIVIQGDDHYRLPWELLYHDHQEIGFLSLHPRCVISRQVRGKGNKAPSAAPKPLRILLFISSPEDLDPDRSRLDFEREEELLFTALDASYSRGEIEIDVAWDGFLSTLIDRLSQDQYHAVILSMHGASAINNDDKKEWGLLFENETTWQGKPVAGSVLAAALEQLPKGHRPSLIVLAACRSARAGETAESILDVARQLHRIGIERVLGMRLSVLDGAASVFNAALFEKLALGESVGRSVSLARKIVGKGAWLKETMGDIEKDPFAQWTLPILLDRTSDGPVVDLSAPVQTRPRSPLPDALPGDGLVAVPSRGAFIGRRIEVRTALGPFFSGKTRHLLFTGPGGVGKTALAGLFARHLMDRYPDMLIMGFRAPFHLESVYEPIRQAAFDGGEELGLLDSIQKEPSQRERLRRMLVSLANRKRSCAFVLDNLETLQELSSLSIASEHEESHWFINTICGLPFPTRVLMTGRYALDGVIDTPVTRHHVGEAPYGDILYRMRRLEWPESMGPEKKAWIYEVLGGNHRAIEWMAQLLDDSKGKADCLLKALAKVKAPVQTPEEAVATVTEGMRQNLLFTELRDQLTEGEAYLLRAASLYRAAVNADGLEIIDAKTADHERRRDRLLDYSLLERAWDRSVDLVYYMVPPIVRELLGEPGFNVKELEALHREMGEYHCFQGEYVTRKWSDDLEAIYHFRQAGAHTEADKLTERVAYFYYSRSNYAEAVSILSEIEARPTPPAPWWALNLYGQCQIALGFYQNAMEVFNRALPVCPSIKEKGATLNNISQIHDARGDYDTALKYLEQSLKIMREIGDKSGEGATLNNLATTAHARGDYDTALKYLEQSLKIRREIGDKSGEGTTLNNISQIYKARGDYDTALKYLEQSLKIRREIGDKSGEGTTLNNISQIHDARGDYDTALKYLEQSLKIMREIGDKSGEGTTLNNISQIYKARGDYDTALKYLKQSLKITREIGDKSGEGTTLNNISQIYDARGDYDTALKYLEQSLKIRREIGDKSGEGATLNNLATTAHARGDYDTALKYLEQSLKIRREIGDKSGEGTTLNNISQIHDARGDYDTALKYLEQSLKIMREIGDKSGEGATLNNLATTAHARGDYDTALKYLEQSLKIRREIGDKSGQIPTLHNMAHIALEANELQRAMDFWSEALDLATKTGNAMGIFHVAKDFGYLMAQLENTKSAAQLLAMAVQVGKAAGLPGVDQIEAKLNSL